MRAGTRWCNMATDPAQPAPFNATETAIFLKKSAPISATHCTLHTSFFSCTARMLDDVFRTTWLKNVSEQRALISSSCHPWWAVYCFSSLLCSPLCSFLCVYPSPCSSLSTSTCALSWTSSSMWTAPRQIYPASPPIEESCSLAEFTPPTTWGKRRWWVFRLWHRFACQCCWANFATLNKTDLVRIWKVLGVQPSERPFVVGHRHAWRGTARDVREWGYTWAPWRDSRKLFAPASHCHQPHPWKPRRLAHANVGRVQKA